MKTSGEWPLEARGQCLPPRSSGQANGEQHAAPGARLLLLFLLLVPFSPAHAGTVHGTVRNGTTGQLAAGVELTLVQPMGGMQEVAHARSGSQGEFSFDHPGIGAQPMLVRATYNNVHFNTMVPPGTGNVQVDIFEPSKDPKTINVTSHFVIFQPSGTALKVAEEYQIENKSQPPRAYFRTDGSFDFLLPEKGELENVAAAGPAGMPVTQLPIDKKHNRYSIAFAFRPGDSTVRYSYGLPYQDNAASLKIPTIYPGARLLLVAPPTLQVSGDGFAAAGQEQGMNLYLRQDVPAGTLVAVNVTGTAPSGGGEAEGAPQGREAQDAGAESGSATIQAVPGRLDSLKWPLLGGFAVVFGLLAYLLSRKTVVAVGGGAVAAEAVPAGKSKKPKGQPTTAPPSASSPSPAGRAPSNGPASLSVVDAAMGTSLDALKESLFRLELRHQAGTITEEEYTRERAKAEKVLRDLVRA